MFADEEKKAKNEPEVKHDYYSSYFDEIEKDAVEQDDKPAKKVTIEDPVEVEEPKKFDWANWGNLSMITAFATIALVVLGKLFIIVGAAICGCIFYWIGGLALLASVGLYVAQMIKNHQVKFEPQLIILILAIVALLI